MVDASEERNATEDAIVQMEAMKKSPTVGVSTVGRELYSYTVENRQTSRRADRKSADRKSGDIDGQESEQRDEVDSPHTGGV